MTLQLTNEQKNIVESDINKNIIVESDAGCGKTFCIVERIKYLVSNNIKQTDIQVLAFNKAIASEIVRKLQHIGLLWVNVDTLDSFVLHYVSTIKHTKPLLSFNGADKWEDDIRKHYTTFDLAKEEFINSFKSFKNKITPTHFIIDECQDMVGRKFEIVHLLMNDKKKIFCVGDKKQKINGFSENEYSTYDTNKIWSIFEEDEQYHLTTSFRTNNNILKQTNKIFDTETTSNIIDDEWNIIKLDDMCHQDIANYYRGLHQKYKNDGQIKILCRTNKDVFKINQLLINFSNSEDNVNKFIDKIFENVLKYDKKWGWCFKTNDLIDFHNKQDSNILTNYFYNIAATCIRTNQRIKLVNKKKGIPYSMWPIQGIGWSDFNGYKREQDKTEEEVRYYLLDEFLKIVNPKVFFPATTIHKSKGLEWPIVILYFTRFKKSKSFKGEDKNLFYVGCTRPKNMLIFAQPKENVVDVDEIIAKFDFNKDNKNIKINKDDKMYISIDATTEIEMNIDLRFHPASGYGSTLHFLIHKFVSSEYKFKFNDIYEFCDNFVYKTAFEKYKESLEKSYNAITKLILKKVKEGFNVYSEYKIYLSEDEIGRVIVAKIDLLLINDDRIEIIDIKSCGKTELLSPDNKYKEQLREYSKAIKKIYPKNSINLKFLIFNKENNEVEEINI